MLRDEELQKMCEVQSSGFGSRLQHWDGVSGIYMRIARHCRSILVIPAKLVHKAQEPWHLSVAEDVWRQLDLATAAEHG